MRYYDLNNDFLFDAPADNDFQHNDEHEQHAHIVSVSYEGRTVDDGSKWGLRYVTHTH